MHRPLRVAHIMGKMDGGGVESVVMNYYRHINRSTVQFDFIIDDDSSMVPTDEIASLGGRVFYVPSYSHLMGYRKALSGLFVTQRWQIVHSHINSLSVIPLAEAERAHVPIRIAHSHSSGGKGERVRNALKGVLRTQSNRYPTHRFACGQFAGEWLFGKNAKFDIVPNAIELEDFDYNAGVRKEMRDFLSIPDAALVIGHVGRFAEQKNHYFLIDAFERLHVMRPDAILLLVGEGKLRPMIEKRVDALGLKGAVRFLGQRKDVNRLYQAFDVFALPSLYEGLCVVGVEAQRAGLPCLFADTITNEIALTDCTCFLPLDDPQQWAIAMDRNKMRCEVRDSDFLAYNIDNAAMLLEERYLALVGRDC